MIRTDIHCPSRIVPGDYSFVAFEHQRIMNFDDCHAILENRARIQAHMGRTGGTYSSHEHGGNCMVCGAHCIWSVLFYHEKTNVYIRTGLDCAEKMELSYGDFNRFKRDVEHYETFKAGKQKAELILNEKGLSTCYGIWSDWKAGKLENFGNEERIIIDIVGKLVQYGSLSEKQFNFLGKLVQDIEKRAQVAIEREKQKALAEDVPTSAGRIKLTGVIITTKVQDSPFGTTIKMLLQDDRGFKLWGTLPSAISENPRRWRVSFQASVEPSKDDSKFGFFKRPSKLEVLSRGE